MPAQDMKIPGESSATKICKVKDTLTQAKFEGNVVKNRRSDERLFGSGFR
jgi:hypothetical protein